MCVLGSVGFVRSVWDAAEVVDHTSQFRGRPLRLRADVKAVVDEIDRYSRALG